MISPQAATECDASKKDQIIKYLLLILLLSGLKLDLGLISVMPINDKGTQSLEAIAATDNNFMAAGGGAEKKKYKKWKHDLQDRRKWRERERKRSVLIRFNDSESIP